MTAGRFGPQLTPSGATFRLWAPAARSVEAIVERATHAHDAVGRRLVRGGCSRRGRGLALPLPDRRRARRSRSCVGYSSRKTLPARASSSTMTPSPGARRIGEAGPGTKPSCSSVMSALSRTEGTYRGLIDKLDHVAATGITAIELMPIGDFPGQRNWGYDGVLWYAPDHTYGSPEDLKQFIDEAHSAQHHVCFSTSSTITSARKEITSAATHRSSSRRRRPRGESAIDYSVPEVRAFAIENALHWLRDYRFDGLRLDAVHALAEPGGLAMLDELSKAVGTLARESGRHLHLVLENDDNRASILDPDTAIPSGRYRAQWNDDYHHAWHVLLTGETHGYYADYARAPRKMIARMLAHGFAYQGEPSQHRGGKARGEPVAQPSADSLRQLPAEPRPDRQSRARRSPGMVRQSGGDRRRIGDHAARADAAAAVHG